ncbi:hypothetical protein K3M67_02980 [Sphingobium sp. V4]|uniref:hypothetical protein n=1 Tax=Sphingobium sp. V4 TaxID=3038927 RepID=UPI002557F935|nr:hypothetical protein [Sphingobium sp. V4]WIW88960.1 hypothetical protein K3M67_02980 [Sphingobium sp. V4]
MPNIQKGEASFKTSAGTFHLVLDFNAFAEAEEAAGMSVADLMRELAPEFDPVSGEVTKKPRIKHLGAILYGGLQARHPGTSFKEAVNMMGDSEDVGEAIARALEGVMAKAEPSAEGKDRGAAGTGTKPKRTGRQKA